ncbi:MAG: hypothetical protein J0I41_15360 [Filimonas sp.]|nr:hypothetical protein [Filimonas sp.]
MKLAIYDNTKVYVPCPANHATGGTEVAHQLVYELNQMGIEAYIYYYRAQKDINPIHPQFQKYVSTHAPVIEDAPENILIVPETRTEYLFRYQSIRKVIWWLSVDFFYDSADIDRISTLKKMLGITKRFNLAKPEKLQVDLHLVQSAYAEDHLRKHGITNIAHLSDYLNAAFLYDDAAPTERKNMVLYNPKKGMQFTQQIIDRSKELYWFPLINLTPMQVAEACRTAKVYIDFGHHPGKDRFPREAAISGCCIITGKKGAASFEKDIPIADKYKFEDKPESILLIIDRIKYCLDKYDQATEDFENYRDIIRKQQSEFQQNLREIFVPANA